MDKQAKEQLLIKAPQGKTYYAKAFTAGCIILYTWSKNTTMALKITKIQLCCVSFEEVFMDATV